MSSGEGVGVLLAVWRLCWGWNITGLVVSWGEDMFLN